MTINAMLGTAKVSYSDLMKVANGTYNKGEIVFSKGLFGGFSKINNHVGALSGRNTVVTTPEQNRLTNAAVFKAILAQYGGRGWSDHSIAEQILDEDLSAEGAIDRLERLERFVGHWCGKDDPEYEDGNPYVKEAFKFLMRGDGAPLSRDEMKALDALLREHKSDGKEAVKTNMKKLENLRRYKNGEISKMSNDEIASAEEWVQGLSVRNISREKENQVTAVTANRLAGHWGDQNAVGAMHRYMPELCKSVDEILMRTIPRIVANPRGSDLSELIDKLNDEFSEKFGSGMLNYKSACPKGKLKEEDFRKALAEGIRAELFKHPSLKKTMEFIEVDVEDAKERLKLKQGSTFKDDLLFELWDAVHFTKVIERLNAEEGPSEEVLDKMKEFINGYPFGALFNDPELDDPENIGDKLPLLIKDGTSFNQSFIRSRLRTDDLFLKALADEKMDFAKKIDFVAERLLVSFNDINMNSMIVTNQAKRRMEAHFVALAKEFLRDYDREKLKPVNNEVNMQAHRPNNNDVGDNNVNNVNNDEGNDNNINNINNINNVNNINNGND